MSKLYLMRHAAAEPGGRMDAARSITDEGKRQVGLMSDLLVKMAVKPKVVLASKFARSIDTATPIAKALDSEVEETSDLEPNDPPQDAWDAVKKMADKDSVLVVTHHPLVNKLMALLVGGNKFNNFHFAHAAVAHLRVNGDVGKLVWLATPDMLVDAEDKSAIALKQWWTKGDACNLCVDNEALGPIPIAAKFESLNGPIDKGKAHDTCTCDIEYL